MKTLRKEKIQPVFIRGDGTIPRVEDMKQGEMYISEKFQTSNHLCLCGCGNQTVLPLTNVGESSRSDGWALYQTNDRITITPSILQQWPCKSHYIITDGVANFV